jgi:hypothetical protein
LRRLRPQQAIDKPPVVLAAQPFDGARSRLPHLPCRGNIAPRLTNLRKACCAATSNSRYFMDYPTPVNPDEISLALKVVATLPAKMKRGISAVAGA